MNDRVLMSDKLYDEIASAMRVALDTQELVEPTDEERRNGWSADSLTAYLAERNAGAVVNVDQNSLHRRMAARPVVQDHRYNPHRWRG